MDDNLMAREIDKQSHRQKGAEKILVALKSWFDEGGREVYADGLLFRSDITLRAAVEKALKGEPFE